MNKVVINSVAKKILTAIPLLIGIVFVFNVFKTISIYMPLSGDDWGYALNGMEGNPFKIALSFYYSWSGRFFSEVWTFFMAAHKEIWNYVNAIIFTLILFFVYKLSDVKKNYLFSAAFVVFSMFYVENNMRMETYTWITGTIYPITLLLALMYFCVVNEYLKNELSKKVKVSLILINIPLFVIGLMMENAAAMMLVSEVLLIIYLFVNNKEINKYLLLNLLVSFASFMVCRMSPGAAFRLSRDSYEWASLPLFEKLIKAYPEFIYTSFTSNKYMIFLLSLSLIGKLIFSKKKNTILKSFFGVFFVFSIGIVFIQINSPVLYVYWPIYVLSVIVTICMFFDDKYLKDKLIFLILVGGSSMVVMLFSPHMGHRNAIYLVYLMIVVTLVIVNTYLNNRYISLLLPIVLMYFTYTKTSYLKGMYQMIDDLNNQRMNVIEYYKEHPEDEDVWIARFPINTVHGTDIDPGDTYHFETFKEYFGLPQDANKIYFYVVE